MVGITGWLIAPFSSARPSNTFLARNGGSRPFCFECSAFPFALALALFFIVLPFIDVKSSFETFIDPFLGDFPFVERYAVRKVLTCNLMIRTTVDMNLVYDLCVNPQYNTGEMTVDTYEAPR